MSSEPEQDRQADAELRRRKYIAYRTLGGMNKKDAALAAGFSANAGYDPTTSLETPEVLEAVERLGKKLISEIPISRFLRTRRLRKKSSKKSDMKQA